MDLSRIIIGPVTTEKSERQKVHRTYTLTVHPAATKVDVQNALKRQYDVDVASVRLIRVHLLINIDPVRAPDNVNIESFADLRNLEIL